MSQPTTTSSHRRKTYLPVLDGDPHLAPRPVFGSPQVAKYGAVGLEINLPEATAPSAGAPAELSVDGKHETYRVSQIEPLPLVRPLAHHQVDADHLWLAVEHGMVCVADDLEHEVMQAFVAGSSPVDAAAKLRDRFDLEAQQAWEVTAKLLGRLAAAGFIEGIRGYHEVKKFRPARFARFHLTQRCQLECVHCYTESSPHLPSDSELSTERWIRLVDEFADNGGERILFTGGEALVHGGCLEIMRRAHDRGMQVTLFSNGILIPRHIEALKEIADVVQISVDGPGPDSHDAVRGPGSFRKAMRAIHLLLGAGIETRVSTTIMMNNWAAIEKDLPNFIGEFEGTALTFRISYGAMSHGRGKHLDHDLDYDAIRRFVNGLLSRVEQTEDRDIGRNAPQKVKGCGYAEQLVIAPDGLVYPCHLLSGALGHVDDMPVADISRYLIKTAEAFSVDNRQGCSTCDLRNLCGGSCRVEDEKHTGSRLITTCTPDEKVRKKRFLVSRYRAAP